MKTFTVEGANWVEDYRVDPTLFDNYEDMALEAMTLALEEFMSMPDDPPSSWHPDCKYASNALPKWGSSHPTRGHEDTLRLGWITLAYEKGSKNKPDKGIMAFTHLVLRNAGHHELANEIEVLWVKGKRKKGKK